jgi:hypothetical protein
VTFPEVSTVTLSPLISGAILKQEQVGFPRNALVIAIDDVLCSGNRNIDNDQSDGGPWPDWPPRTKSRHRARFRRCFFIKIFIWYKFYKEKAPSIVLTISIPPATNCG